AAVATHRALDAAKHALIVVNHQDSHRTTLPSLIAGVKGLLHSPDHAGEPKGDANERKRDFTATASAQSFRRAASLAPGRHVAVQCGHEGTARTGRKAHAG